MKHIIGVADMKVSNNPDDVIVTYALGSCLGVTVYDPVAQVGGMLHVMLPLSAGDPGKAAVRPFMFVDTGVPRLFIECYKAGARKQRIVVKAAGGACRLNGEREDYFEIGKRNFIILRKILWKNGLLLKAHDVGGHNSRTISLSIGTGEVTQKSNGLTETL